MALIDVVSVQMNNDLLVAKFPSEDLRLGSQLVVYPGQIAFFLKGGEILDEFTSGTYTLKSENLPLLNKIINIPFGGNSPFRAEVWFVNMTAIMASKWGTATPLQIEDPKYEIIVPLRGYGQYSFRIKEPRLFLETLVGNQTQIETSTIREYFKGRVMSLLTNVISDKLVKDGISILNLNSHLNDISEFCKFQLDDRFKSYGLSISEFDIMSITPKEDDESFQKLKEAKDMAARLKITGKDVYQMQRSFDVLETAAGNEGGAGALMGAGVGLGVGVGMGNQMGQVSSMINTSPAPQTPPPLPQNNKQYFIAINGQQAGPYNYDNIMQYISSNQITNSTLIWCAGMPSWQAINTLSEFQFAFCTPPPLP